MNDKPLKHQVHEEKTLYIYKEVFDIKEPYVLCSYTDNRKGMFKLNKNEL